MRTNARRGACASTLVVLTAVVGLPGRAEAQHTGLFPLAPIRRQRVPCDQEDPTYKIYKHQYFGYHPTCWRAFPPGWGCPNEQAPNWEKSQRELPVGGNREDLGAGAGPGPGLGPDQGPGAPQPRRPDIPGLPREGRDPFEMDEPAGRVPNANPLPRGNAPGATQPRTNSPFEDLNPRGASIAPGRDRAQPRGNTAMPDEGTPELSAPARQPAQGSASRSGRDEAEADELAEDNRGPLLGLADSDIARSDTNAGDDLQAGAAPAAAASGPAATAVPAAQPRRRILGNLFSSLGSNWTRR